MPVCATLEVSPKPKPALSVTNIVASPASVTAGQTTLLTITVRNDGNAAGSGTVSVTANGAEISRFDTGTIEAGTSVEFDVEWTPTETGTFDVCAEVV